VDPKNWAHEEMQISKFRGDHEIVIVNPVAPIPAELQQPATQQMVKQLGTGFMYMGEK
jgi:hypothetical protein